MQVDWGQLSKDAKLASLHARLRLIYTTMSSESRPESLQQASESRVTRYSYDPKMRLFIVAISTDRSSTVVML